MAKRRRIEPGQDVVIIYDSRIGFTQEPAVFKRYERIIYGDVEHEIPMFDYKGETITGLDCFWILPADANTPERIERIQYELLSVQVVVLQIAKRLGYQMPNKMGDKAMEVMADDKEAQIQSMIQRLGFDPRDESWVEDELASTPRERHWYAFERENALIFAEEWDDLVEQFNKKYSDTISPEEAKNLTKKRVRYLLGAFHTRMTGNADKDAWKQAAGEFETFHRERENRMLTWTLARKEKFPRVRVKKPVRFVAGPYRHVCLEKIPHLFLDIRCTKLKENVTLRVLSSDIKHKYIRLDFLPEVRRMIKGQEAQDVKPWLKDLADYDIWVQPGEIDDHLDILESLE